MASPKSRVLILGSMPGAASLRERQYYAHPRNQFWAIMERLFGVARELPYAERCRRLTANGIAVWDVVERCRRRGSLDANIAESSIVVNDIAAFLKRYRGIRHVFFNGAKSERIYARHVSANVGNVNRPIECQRLPSTSPAHAGLSEREKLRQWQVVAGHVHS